MKVFISWSKNRSHQIAQLLTDWIPCVLQSVTPWLSSQNIEDGELWFTSIQNQVADIINGLICLTKENLNEPWILFEAGGLAKGLERSRIYILLIDIESNDFLLSPLAAFNHTKPTEAGLRKLMHTINGRTIKPVATNVVDQVFDKFWPDFNTKFDEIIAATEVSDYPNTADKKSRSDNDELKPLLEEILKSIRKPPTSTSTKSVQTDVFGNYIESVNSKRYETIYGSKPMPTQDVVKGVYDF